MDFNTLVWTIALCLAFQRHMDDHLLSFGTESFDKKAKQTTHSTHRNEVHLRVLMQQALEELRAQRVLAALVSNFGKVEAHKIFPRAFLFNPYLSKMASSSYNRTDGELVHFDVDLEVGGTNVAPSSSI